MIIQSKHTRTLDSRGNQIKLLKCARNPSVPILAILAIPITACVQSPPLVEITQWEWAIEPLRDEVKAGEVTFMVTNTGNLEHNFVVEGMDETIELILPQDTQSMSVTLRPGTYTLICDLSGHREAGMETQFTVTP